MAVKQGFEPVERRFCKLLMARSLWLNGFVFCTYRTQLSLLQYPPFHSIRPGSWRHVGGGTRTVCYHNPGSRAYHRVVRRVFGLVVVLVLLFGFSTDAFLCADGCRVPGHLSGNNGGVCLTCGFPAVLAGSHVAAPTVAPRIAFADCPPVRILSGAVIDHFQPPRSI